MYLKFVLDQGYWPESTSTPPSDEAIQYDIRMTKEMGFNGARKHQKVGGSAIPVLGRPDGLPGFRRDRERDTSSTKTMCSAFTREWTEAVERDYNHPSIIIWNVINESWGVPNLAHDPRQVAHLRSTYLVTKSLDSDAAGDRQRGLAACGYDGPVRASTITRATGDLLFEKYKELRLEADAATWGRRC